MKNQAGVTMIELLIVLALSAIIFSMGFSAYISWQRQVQVTNTTEEIRSVLLRAQQLATAAAKDSSWGLHLEEDTYVMFRGDFYNINESDNLVWQMQGTRIISPTTTFADGAGGTAEDLVFIKFTGLTHNTGTINIVSAVDANASRQLEIQASGRID